MWCIFVMNPQGLTVKNPCGISEIWVFKGRQLMQNDNPSPAYLSRRQSPPRIIKIPYPSPDKIKFGSKSDSRGVFTTTGWHTLSHMGVWAVCLVWLNSLSGVTRSRSQKLIGTKSRGIVPVYIGLNSSSKMFVTTLVATWCTMVFVFIPVKREDIGVTQRCQ